VSSNATLFVYNKAGVVVVLQIKKFAHSSLKLTVLFKHMLCIQLNVR